MYRKGIDVSKWQGSVDWQAVKDDGIEFAMLRAGYGQGNIDPQFERNASECTRLGIPFGVYWFSYAYTPEMARREASSAYRRPRRISCNTRRLSTLNTTAWITPQSAAWLLRSRWPARLPARFATR